VRMYVETERSWIPKQTNDKTGCRKKSTFYDIDLWWTQSLHEA
jgi:hypothetical protein